MATEQKPPVGELQQLLGEFKRRLEKYRALEASLVEPGEKPSEEEQKKQEQFLATALERSQPKWQETLAAAKDPKVRQELERGQDKPPLDALELARLIEEETKQDQRAQTARDRKDAQAGLHEICKKLRPNIIRLSRDSSERKENLDLFDRLSKYPVGNADAITALIEGILDGQSGEPRAQTEQPAPPTNTSTARIQMQAATRDRKPDLAVSRQRLKMEDDLRGELTTIADALSTGKCGTVDQLRNRFPDFQLWKILSPQEQRELQTLEYKPKAFARNLVIRRFAITESTLKYMTAGN